MSILVDAEQVEPVGGGLFGPQECDLAVVEQAVQALVRNPPEAVQGQAGAPLSNGVCRGGVRRKGHAGKGKIGGGGATRANFKGGMGSRVDGRVGPPPVCDIPSGGSSACPSPAP